MILSEFGLVDDSSGRILMSVNGKMYHVSPAVAVILRGMAVNHSVETITENINVNAPASRDVTSAETQALISKYESMFLGGTQHSRELSSIYFRVTLLRFIESNLLIRLLSTFFKSEKLFYSLFLIAALTNIVACNTFVNAPLNYLNNFSLIIFIIPFSFLLSMLHELGHVSASSRFGVKVTNIGAGIYFGFPVLYSDLNEVWRLNSRRRIIISLGGIYLQLLINIPLFFFLYFADGFAKDVLTILVYTNIASTIINIIPFAKLDGYWVISDIFSRPNLEREAKQAIKQLALRMIGKHAGESFIFDRWLISYAVLQFIYYVAILSLLFIFGESFVRDLLSNARDAASMRTFLANHAAQLIVFLIISVRILSNAVSWVRGTWRTRSRLTSTT